MERKIGLGVTMISEEDKRFILELARKYKVKRVVLFGSGAKLANDNRDIDLAVDGLPGREFFKFYSELIFGLSKPIDLIDISKKTKFAEVLTSDGVQIYG